MPGLKYFPLHLGVIFVVLFIRSSWLRGACTQSSLSSLWRWTRFVTTKSPIFSSTSHLAVVSLPHFLLQNLLVTSTLTRSTSPPAVPEPEAKPEAEPGTANGPPKEDPDPTPSGELPTTSNEDKEMVEAEANEDASAKDEQTQEEMASEQDASGSSQNHA